MEKRSNPKGKKNARNRINLSPIVTADSINKIDAISKANKTKKGPNNNQKRNRVIAVALISILLIFGLFKLIDGKKEADDGLIYNKNKSFIKEQKIKGIKFKNIKCSYDGKNSLISYIIVNETNKKIYLNNYDIVIKDKKKQPITKIVASYGQNIPPRKDIKMANSVIGQNLTNAYYMELKLKTEKK